MTLIFDLDGTLFQAKPVVAIAGTDASVPGYIERLKEALCECGELFPGTSKMLSQLYYAGHKLVICSKSPPEYIDLVLEYTEISGYFTGQYSSEGYASKTGLIKEIIEPGEQAIIIGDTHGDITAAIENGLPSIAAMYGYGNKSMLAGADFFAKTTEEIARHLEQQG